MGRVQGEGGREKNWERQGGQAGRKDELERQWTLGVNVKWEVEQLVQKRNTLHAAQPLSHITSISIPSPKSPFPACRLSSQPTCTRRIGHWLGLAGAKGCRRLGLVSGGCRKTHREKTLRGTRRERGSGTCEIDSRTVEWTAQGMPGAMWFQGGQAKRGAWRH